MLVSFDNWYVLFPKHFQGAYVVLLAGKMLIFAQAFILFLFAICT